MEGSPPISNSALLLYCFNSHQSFWWLCPVLIRQSFNWQTLWVVRACPCPRGSTTVPCHKWQCMRASLCEVIRRLLWRLWISSKTCICWIFTKRKWLSWVSILFKGNTLLLQSHSFHGWICLLEWTRHDFVCCVWKQMSRVVLSRVTRWGIITQSLVGVWIRVS